MGLKRNSKGEITEVNPLRTRKGTIYIKGSNTTFKISRSKFANFLECKRCFYLERVKGLKDPSMPGWSLNSAVDDLLKKEFDEFRKKQKPHTFVKKKGHIVISMLPILKPNIDRKVILKEVEKIIEKETNKIIYLSDSVGSKFPA